MDEKLNSETQDKQTAPEVKDETLDQVNGGSQTQLLWSLGVISPASYPFADNIGAARK